MIRILTIPLRSYSRSTMRKPHKKVAAAAAAKTAQAKPAAVKKDLKKDDNENKENKNQRFEGKRVFDARKPQDGPREERNRVNQEGGAPRRDYDDENRRGRGGRGGGRGMGRGRGGGEGGMRREGGGNRDGAPRGKREFERKSGDGRTGVKAEEKRGGGGKGNWGTMQDELKGVTEEGNVTIDENAAPKEDGEKNEETIEKVIEEEEPKQFTLDEWKALQKVVDEKPSFNVRKAGEGADIDPKWKKAAAYKKEKADDDDVEYHEIVVSQRSNRVKHLNVDLHFADQQSGGRGGGRGRGRGRGGGDRGGRGRGGGDRGGRGGGRDGDYRRAGSDKPQQFSLDDSKAFPALAVTSLSSSAWTTAR